MLVGFSIDFNIEIIFYIKEKKYFIKFRKLRIFVKVNLLKPTFLESGILNSVHIEFKLLISLRSQFACNIFMKK